MPTACAAIPGRDRSNVCIAIAKPCPSSPSRLPTGTRDAVERELGRRRAADAHLVLEAGDGEPGAIGLHEDRRQAPAGPLGVRVGDGEHHDVVRDARVADEALAAVDDVVVAVAHRARPEARTGRSRRPPRSGRRRSACSPDARPGSQRSCCSGVPATWIGIAPSDWTATIRPDVAHTRLICSIARHRVSRSAPSPPCSLRERDREDVVAREQLPDVVGPLGRRGRSRRPGGRSARRRATARRRAGAIWSSVRRIEPWAGACVVTGTHRSSRSDACPTGRSSGMTPVCARP